MEYSEPNEPEIILSIEEITAPAPPPVLSVPSTDNFKLSEFKCKDGTSVPKSYYANVQELMNNLQTLRDYLGTAIHINSGYRTESHNKKIGGAKNSQHKIAKAADMRVPGKTPKQVKDAIEHLIRTGRMKNGGVGLYRTFVHYDTRSTPTRW